MYEEEYKVVDAVNEYDGLEPMIQDFEPLYRKETTYKCISVNRGIEFERYGVEHYKLANGEWDSAHDYTYSSEYHTHQIGSESGEDYFDPNCVPEAPDPIVTVTGVAHDCNGEEYDVPFVTELPNGRIAYILYYSFGGGFICIEDNLYFSAQSIQKSIEALPFRDDIKTITTKGCTEQIAFIVELKNGTQYYVHKALGIHGSVGRLHYLDKAYNLLHI